MLKDSSPFELANLAETLSAIDIVRTQNSSRDQQICIIPSSTPKGDSGNSSNEFAALSSPNLGVGGISSESLAGPAPLSEYFTKLVDQGRKGFMFGEDPDWQTFVRRLEEPENGTSSFLRNLRQLEQLDPLYVIGQVMEACERRDVCVFKP